MSAERHKPLPKPPGMGALAALLRRHGIHLSRRFGQHLLADDHVLQVIAEASGAGPGTRVVEVGAGAGALTRLLAASGARVTAIELDQRFRGIHEMLVLARPDAPDRMRFEYMDALAFDYAAAAREAAAEGLRFLIAGNIPYQITSPLIMGILLSGAPFAAMTFMVQREVAERLAAGPGTKRNGGITVKVNWFCRVETICDVPRGAFLPPPEVESRVIRFVPRDERPGPPPAGLFALVDAAFGQRRKTLPNSVAAAGIGVDKTTVEKALDAMGLGPAVRAEGLGTPEFLALHEALIALGWSPK